MWGMGQGQENVIAFTHSVIGELTISNVPIPTGAVLVKDLRSS